MSPSLIPSINRRRLLQVAGLSSFMIKAANAEYAPIPNTWKAHLTPALNAYSFLEQLNANLADAARTGIDLFGVCDFCVKHDIQAVD